MKQNKKEIDKSYWLTVSGTAIFIIAVLVLVTFFYYQNQKLRNLISNYQNKIKSYDECVKSPGAKLLESYPAVCVTTDGHRFTQPVSAPVPPPATPVLFSPNSGAKITSPLTITGIVPAGWMFEGVFPIKLIDSNRNSISQTQAKENVPGSWQSGNSVDFTATLVFRTASTSGFLVLENDNPSGDPKNLKTFEIPINF